MSRQGTKNIGKAISYIAIILVLVAVCGLLAYFTNGFTSDFKTFYVESNGKQVLATSDGFVVSNTEPLNVVVKYTFSSLNKEVSGYSVKIVPNAVEGKDFDIVLDGSAYSFQAENDMTAGFNIEKSESSFKVSPKGGINDILQAVYPSYTIGDARGKTYENMFSLIVTSYNGESSVKLNFTIEEKIEGVILDKEVIVF